MTKINSTIRQFQHESDAWKRMLEFWLQENVYFKNRLAEVVSSNSIASDFLESAEIYQSRFIQYDEVMNLLHREIEDLDKLLVRDSYGNGMLLKTIFHKQKKLRRELKSLETAFGRLKIQFNNYLSEM